MPGTMNVRNFLIVFILNIHFVWMPIKVRTTKLTDNMSH